MFLNFSTNFFIEERIDLIFAPFNLFTLIILKEKKFL